MIFNIHEGDRIAKFDMAWSHDTAEGKHMKSLPYLACARSISSQLTKRHTVTSVLVSQAKGSEVRPTAHS